MMQGAKSGPGSMPRGCWMLECHLLLADDVEDQDRASLRAWDWASREQGRQVALLNHIDDEVE